MGHNSVKCSSFLANFFSGVHLTTFFEKNIVAYIPTQIGANYKQLMNSENFVTQLNSLKLLAELMTDRNNIAVMKKYINDSENLKLIMNLLLHQAPVIKNEAFSIFKIFVLNPKKPEDINFILLKNKDLLRILFVNFLPELADLNLFQAEKSMIVKEINDL